MYSISTKLAVQGLTVPSGRPPMPHSAFCIRFCPKPTLQAIHSKRQRWNPVSDVGFHRSRRKFPSTDVDGTLLAAFQHKKRPQGENRCRALGIISSKRVVLLSWAQGCPSGAAYTACMILVTSTVSITQTKVFISCCAPYAPAVAQRTYPCYDIYGADDVFNSVFVTPDGMNAYYAAQGDIFVYRTHTVIPHTQSPTEAPTHSPVTPTPSPTRGEVVFDDKTRREHTYKCTEDPKIPT